MAAFKVTQLEFQEKSWTREVPHLPELIGAMLHGCMIKWFINRGMLNPAFLACCISVLCRHHWAIQMFRHHHNCHHNNNRPVSSPPWIFTVLQLEHRQQAKQLPWRIASSDHRLWLLLVEVAWTEWFLFKPVELTKKRWGRVAHSWATQSQSTTFP